MSEFRISEKACAEALSFKATACSAPADEVEVTALRALSGDLDREADYARLERAKKTAEDILFPLCRDLEVSCRVELPSGTDLYGWAVNVRTLSGVSAARMLHARDLSCVPDNRLDDYIENFCRHLVYSLIDGILAKRRDQ